MGDDRTPTSGNWTTTQSYILATICLLIGIAVGYLIRGSALPNAEATSVNQAQVAAPSPEAANSGMAQQQPTPEQMRRMADAQAEPLLAQLKNDPKNGELIYKIGNIYYDTQQFPEAVKYYERALQLDPKSVDIRTDMATAYHFMGQSDRALQEYNAVLKIDGHHANALFNQGMVKWQDKMDMKGAVSAWKKLLETNPDFPQRQKVEGLIANAEQHMNIKPGTKTDKPADIAR